jgi:hypothetical protein
MSSDFPLKDAEGAAMRIEIPDDSPPVQPTVMDLDGTQGRVIETATKDAAVTTIDVASVLLDGEQYIITENDDTSVMLFADGVEVYVPHECLVVERKS